MWGAEDTDQGSKAEKQRWKGQKETETSGKGRVGGETAAHRQDAKKERNRNCQERQGLKKKKKERKTQAPVSPG